MKTKFTALLLYMLCIVHVNAQQKTDGFFNSEPQTRAIDAYSFYNDEEVGFYNMNVVEDTVPLGDGLFALTVVSVSYLTLKRKEGRQ